MRAAFQQGTDQVVAFMVKAQAEETSARHRVVIGRYLTGHEAVEHRSVGTGARVAGLVDHYGINAAALALALFQFVQAKVVAPPAQRCTKSEGSAFDVPCAWHAVPAPPKLVALDAVHAVEMGNHHAGCADGELRHALPDNARADCCALLVARATA